MSTSATDLKGEALRARNVQSMPNLESSQTGRSGESTPQTEEEMDKEMKTFGRTPNGTSKSLRLYLSTLPSTWQN